MGLYEEGVVGLSVEEVLFLLQFLAVIGILGVKLFNVFRKGEFVSLQLSILLFAGFFVAWLVGFVVMLLYSGVGSLLYSVLMRLETWLIGLNVLFFVFELFFNLAGLPKVVGRRRNSLEAYKE